MDRQELSKTISYILRHRPDAAGVSLDTHGWCRLDALLEGLARLQKPASREQVEEVVRKCDKQRFVLEGDRIRAAQGHSVASVMPVLQEKHPPSRLFHGTIAANLESIERAGLLPMNRHHVHLSPDEPTARAVGGRRGKPTLLVIDAARMAAEGYKFFVSDNGVWLTDKVPPQFLFRLSA